MAEGAGRPQAALCLACAARGFALCYGTAFFFVYLLWVLESGTALPSWLGISGALAAGAGEVAAGFIRDHLARRRTLLRACLIFGAAASLVLMFTLPSRVDTPACCAPAFYCFIICFCSGNGGFMGGISEFASRAHLRESLLSLPQGIGLALSTALCSVFACLLYFDNGNGDVEYVFTSGAAVAALFMLIFREPPETRPSGSPQMVKSPRQAIRLIASNDQLLVAAAAAFLR